MTVKKSRIFIEIILYLLKLIFKYNIIINYLYFNDMVDLDCGRELRIWQQKGYFSEFKPFLAQFGTIFYLLLLLLLLLLL